MGSVKDKKNKIFGFIAAARLIAGDSKIPGLDALTKSLTGQKTGLPKVTVSTSFPSINNGGDPILFLTDLIKSLIGFDALVVGLTDMLTYSVPDIVNEIKKLLKSELKQIVSCGVDPSIPSYMATGIDVEVKKIDFFNIFKIDPNSTQGKLVYNDITSPLTNSTDLNTFLYGVIQDDGVPYIWKNIFEITFNSVGTSTRPNNSLTIKTVPAYSTKTLTDMNNDFINGLTLFDPSTLINNLIDNIFGTVSSSLRKSISQLQKEEEINNVVDCLVNSDEGDTIDDSYFSFDNEEVYVHQQQAEMRQKGIRKLQCCNKVAASVPLQMLTNLNTELSGATSTEHKKQIITSNITSMANQTTVNSKNDSDNMSIKLDFIQNIIQTLIKSIVQLILTPKIIMIFVLNFKIIYGELAEFGGAIDFIKKNKNLIKAIAKKVAGIIIKFLIVMAIKEITQLVAASEAKKQIEKAKSRVKQITSLTGMNMDVLKYINVQIK